MGDCRTCLYEPKWDKNEEGKCGYFQDGKEPYGLYSYDIRKTDKTCHVPGHGPFACSAYKEKGCGEEFGEDDLRAQRNALAVELAKTRAPCGHGECVFVPPIVGCATGPFLLKNPEVSCWVKWSMDNPYILDAE